MFRRFVGQALLTLRLLGEAPVGDSVRRMDAGFGGIVPLCRRVYVVPELRVGCGIPGERGQT